MKHDTSSDIISQEEAECQPFVSLRFETDDEVEYISWKGDRMLRELVTRGISTVVVGAPGSGRSVAVFMAEFTPNDDGSYGSNGEIDVFPGLLGEELELQIFPQFPETRLKPERQWQKHIKVRGDGLSLSCGFCPRHCPLSGVGHPGSFESLFLLVASKVEGYCPLRLELGIQNLIKQSRPTIIDVNDVKTVAPIACELLRSRIPVVLVASPQQARQLTSYPDIAALPIIQFPSMDDATIKNTARVRGCNDDRIFELAKGSPRRLTLGVAMISQAKEIMPIEVEAISIEKTLQLEQPKRTLDERVEEYCQSHTGTKIKPKEVAEWLFQKYGQTASAEQVGRILNRHGRDSRHTRDGSVYSI